MNIPNRILKREPKSFARWLLIGYIQAGITTPELICGMGSDYNELMENNQKHLETWVKWSRQNTEYSQDDCSKYWDDLVFKREEVWNKLMKIL